MKYHKMIQRFLLVILMGFFGLVSSSTIDGEGIEEEGKIIDFQKEYNTADVVIITFYTDTSREEVCAKVTIAEAKDIADFLADLKGLTALCAKCGYDGTITFSSHGQDIGDLAFNLSCGQIHYQNGCCNMDAACIARLEAYKTQQCKENGTKTD